MSFQDVKPARTTIPLRKPVAPYAETVWVKNVSPTPQALPLKRPFVMPSKPVKPRRRLPDWLQLPLIIGAGMVAGVFVQSAALGQLLVLVYGAVALVWQIASRITFMLAALALSAAALLLITKGDVALAQHFATLTFLLLVVGVISLSRELKREGGRLFHNRRNI